MDVVVDEKKKELVSELAKLYKLSNFPILGSPLALIT
jgi:hypothetical protein